MDKLTQLEAADRSREGKPSLIGQQQIYDLDLFSSKFMFVNYLISEYSAFFICTYKYEYKGIGQGSVV